MGKIGGMVSGLLALVFLILVVAGLSGSPTANADAQKASDNIVGSMANAGVALLTSITKAVAGLGDGSAPAAGGADGDPATAD